MLIKIDENVYLNPMYVVKIKEEHAYVVIYTVQGNILTKRNLDDVVFQINDALK